MDPQKAASLGVKPEEVKIESYADRYSGDWLIFVPDEERGMMILTSTPDIFAACRWRRRLGEIVNGA